MGFGYSTSQYRDIEMYPRPQGNLNYSLQIQGSVQGKEENEAAASVKNPPVMNAVSQGQEGDFNKNPCKENDIQKANDNDRAGNTAPTNKIVMSAFNNSPNPTRVTSKTETITPRTFNDDNHANNNSVYKKSLYDNTYTDSSGKSTSDVNVASDTYVQFAPEKIDISYEQSSEPVAVIKALSMEEKLERWRNRKSKGKAHHSKVDNRKLIILKGLILLIIIPKFTNT